MKEIPLKLMSSSSDEDFKFVDSCPIKFLRWDLGIVHAMLIHFT